MPFREGPATRGPTRLCELLGPGGSLEDRHYCRTGAEFWKLTSVRASPNAETSFCLPGVIYLNSPPLRRRPLLPPTPYAVCPLTETMATLLSNETMFCAEHREAPTSLV